MSNTLINIDSNIALPEVESKLKQLFGDKLCKIILYGSYASGNYDNESDVDILVIINDNNFRKYNKDLSLIELELCNKYGFLFSIIPENEDYFSKIHDTELGVVLFDGTVRNGEIEKSKLKKLRNWLVSHQTELMVCWQRAQRGIKPGRIQP